MTVEFGIILVLAVLFVVRELLNYFQTRKLEELLKARDLSEFYSGKKKKSVGKNPIAKEEPNEIPLDETRPFTLPKEFNLEIEGEEEPRKIRIFPDGTPTQD